MVRILYVYTHTIHGGGETYLLRILDGIDKARFSPLVAISKRNERLAGELASRGLPFVALPDINLRWEHKVVKALVQMPNFIVLNAMIGWIILRQRIAVVHAGMFYSALFSVIPAKLFGRKFIWVALTEPDITRYPALTKMLLSLSDRTVSVCKYFAELAERARMPGAKKIQVIYTGLTADRFAVHSSGAKFGMNGFEVPRPAVGLIARFDESQKGHRYFWEMAAIVHRSLPKTNFIVAGAPATPAEEEFRSRLEGKSRELGIGGNIFLIGHIKDVPGFLSVIDLLVVPSTHEGAPVVAQEAAAAGKPVVAFPAGGTSELIKEGETGFVVPMRNAHALAEKVIMLLSNPKALATMGNNAKHFAEERFRERPFIASYEKLYEVLVNA